MNTTEMAICFLGMEKKANLFDYLSAIGSPESTAKFNGAYEMARGVDVGRRGAGLGALIGGLGGAGYGLYRQGATDDENERKNPGILRKALLGALAGGVLGGGSGGAYGVHQGNQELQSGRYDLDALGSAVGSTQEWLKAKARQ